QMYVSLSNINPNQDINIEIVFNDFNIEKSELTAKILRSEQINAHNTFESPETVRPEKYTNEKFSMKKNNLVFKMPSKAILVIKIK
ncbi:MAG: alpha-L-arabinofuranosidase C-terminal domain-containing protein, partial [Candidatus Thorarchaeota archaeon]